jgi:uncharacterized membrane protein YfhO
VINGAFLGVWVPPGRGTLELCYEPPGFAWPLSALTAIVWLAVALRNRLFAAHRFR